MALIVRKGILVIFFRDEEHATKVNTQAWYGDPGDDFKDFSIEIFMSASRNVAPVWVDSCELDDLDRMLDRMVQKLANPDWGSLTRTEDVRLVNVAFHQIFVAGNKIIARFEQAFKQVVQNSYIRLLTKEVQGDINRILDKAARTGYFPEMGSGVTPNLYYKPLLFKRVEDEKPREWLVSSLDDDSTDSRLS